MTTKDIDQYESVQYWLEGLAKGTKYNYYSEFPTFLEYLKTQGITLNPDEIIDQRREDLASKDRKIQKRWEHIVATWYRELYDDPEVAEFTASSKLRTVRSFFGRNGYGLHFRRKEIPTPTPSEIEYVPTNDDVRTMFELAESTRDKALILALYQTGLSEQDVASWILERFLPVLKSQDHYFEYYRGKTKVLVQNCLGEDLCVALRNYLVNRGNPTTGPVFVSSTKGAGQAMTTRTICEAIMRIAKRAEMPENFKVKYFRDAFRSACEGARIPSDTTERMMGWQLGGAKRHYRIPKPRIVEAYSKTYSMLTINHSVRTTDKYAPQVAEFNARLLEIITSEDPKKKAMELLAEVNKVSMDLIEGQAFPSFKALVKRALEQSRA